MIKKLFEDYFKTGNAEKFYGNYYAQVPLKSTIFFKGLSRNAATLLATKVADFIQSFCKGTKSSDKNKKQLGKSKIKHFIILSKT